MSRHEPFVLPPQLEEHRELVAEAHAKLLHETSDLSRFTAEMPPVSFIDSERSIGYVDYVPGGDYDPKGAIVVPQTFGNAHGVNWFIRLRLLQESLEEGMPTRIVAFPSPSSRSPKSMPSPYVPDAVRLNPGELERVATGDFSPVAERYFRVLDKLGIERFHVIGYSQGASIGAIALALAAEKGHFDTGNSGLFEPSNLRGEPNSSFRQRLAYAYTFLDYLKAVNETGLQAFTQVQQARVPQDLISQVADTLKSRGGDTAIPEQVALEAGLRGSTFIQDVRSFLGNNAVATLLVVRGTLSALTPESGFQVLRGLEQHQTQDGQEVGRLRLMELKRYGHGFGNNLPAYTILAHLALQGVSIPETVHGTGAMPSV